MKKAVLLGLIAIVITSCGKSDNPTITPIDPNDSTGTLNPSTATCRPISFELNTSAVYPLSDDHMYDSLVYDAGGMITDLYGYNNGDRHWKFSYNGSLPTGWTTVDHPTTYQTIKYIGSSIDQIRYEFDADNTYDSLQYTYSSGKVSRIDYMFVSGVGTIRDKHYTLYTYNATGLLIDEKFYNKTGLYTEVKYTYDTTTNKLFLANNKLFTYFYSVMSPEERLWVGLFKNGKLFDTITVIDASGTHAYNVTYSSNTNGYPAELRLNGQNVMKIHYDCK
ncbi:MAG: hypothetical protein EOO89_00055 [Pedobacter sp.]|nr:MAG: hypothetical protein EOO89_00055 [Pedobacter sp.]